MSGQYPPPNPSHPFTRAPTLPPWGQTSGMNMVRSSMNFYGSPHLGLPGRGGQPWIPRQTHPKPAEPNPMCGLQMLMSADGVQRRPSVTDYQQEETMDLSSHSSTPADPLRNGTVLPEVNGEVDSSRKEQDVGESVVTSVIAPNPLRESVIDALNCTKTTDNSVLKRIEQSQIVSESSKAAEHFPADISSKVSEPSEYVNSSISSGLKTTCIIEQVNTLDPVGTDCDIVVDNARKDIEQSASVKKNEAFNDSISASEEADFNKSQSSYLERSSMTIDTDDSRLVVAESSDDDIFGISPRLESEDKLQMKKLSVQPTSSSLHDTLSSVSTSPFSLPSDAILPIAQGTSQTVVTVSSETEVSETRDTPEQAKVTSEIQPQTGDVMQKVTEAISLPSEKDLDTGKLTKTTVSALTSSKDDSEPHPSVENVETLLENMFNSQEETSCSSQISGGIPQSVIVSSGPKVTGDIQRPPEMIIPMREEELARTLAEDDNMVEETDIDNEKKHSTITDEIMDEIEKKLEMLTESSSSKQNVDEGHSKMEGIEINKEESCEVKPIVDEKDLREALSSDHLKPQADDKPLEQDVNTEVLTLQTETGQSSNPFIEVETELEKMFAGIVEPTDGACSDSQFQSTVSEPKKPVVNRKPVVKRKKANSRRPSENSVFGGSSGENTPIRKKARKRQSDIGSEKPPHRKVKIEGGDIGRKGRVLKDTSSDNLSRWKGPYVHIEGSKESPAIVVVVNSGNLRVDDDETIDKASARRRHSSVQRAEGRKAGPSYSSSTLSVRYNSDTPDLSWVCVFCKRRPHCTGPEPMGDLFGPYRIPATAPGEESPQFGVPSDRDVVEEQKRRSGGKHAKSLRASGGTELFVHKHSKKNKRSQSMDGWESQAGLLQVEDGYEVWMHGLCAQWAPGLCMIGMQLVGLEEAVWAALRVRCNHCEELGASIGCVVRNCPLTTHYHCAAKYDWHLDSETFIARCPSHRTRLRPT